MVYLILAATFIVMVEFVFPTWLAQEVPFYTHTMGRGVFLLFIGVLALGYADDFKTFLGAVVLMVSVICFMLRAFGVVGLPPPMLIGGTGGQSEPLLRNP